MKSNRRLLIPYALPYVAYVGLGSVVPASLGPVWQSHRVRRPGGRRTRHDFLVVRLWGTRVEELVARFPAPLAALGPLSISAVREGL